MENKVEKLGDALMALSTNETLQLKAYLESKGLKVEQPVAVAKEEVVDDTPKASENVNLRLLKSAGLIKLAKSLMTRTGKSATDIKKMAEVLPVNVFENIPRAQGEAMLGELLNELASEGYEFDIVDC